MQSEQTVRRKQLTMNFLTYIKPCLVHISWYIHCILVWITVETLENLTSHDLNNFGYSFNDKLRLFSPKCKLKLTWNTDISIYLPPGSNDIWIYRKAFTPWNLLSPNKLNLGCWSFCKPFNIAVGQMLLENNFQGNFRIILWVLDNTAGTLIHLCTYASVNQVSTG